MMQILENEFQEKELEIKQQIAKVIKTYFEFIDKYSISAFF